MAPIAVPEAAQRTMDTVKAKLGLDASASIASAGASTHRTLDAGWSFHQVPSSFDDNAPLKEADWITVDKVPTSVHVELIKQGKIVDPFKGLGEWDVQVGSP